MNIHKIFLKSDITKKIYLTSILFRLILLTNYKKYYSNDIQILKKLFYLVEFVSPIYICIQQSSLNINDFNNINIITNFIIKKIIKPTNIENNSIIINKFFFPLIYFSVNFYQFFFCCINLEYKFNNLILKNINNILIIPYLFNLFFYFIFDVLNIKIDLPKSKFKKIIDGELTTYESITTVNTIIIMPLILIWIVPVIKKKN